MPRPKNDNFAIIGLGTFGGTVATELAQFGNHVLGIDIDEAKVSQFAQTLDEAIIADCRDEVALKEVGVEKYDAAVVAIGEDLEASIVCTMNLKLLGVPSIWVKAISRTHHRILKKIGADRIIHPEEEIGQHIAQMLHNPLVRDYVSLGNGYHIVDIRIPERLNEKKVVDLGLENQTEIISLGMMRGSEYMSCVSDETLLQTDDKLLLLGRRQSLRDFAEKL